MVAVVLSLLVPRQLALHERVTNNTVRLSSAAVCCLRTAEIRKVELKLTRVTRSASWLSVNGLASSRYFCARSLPKGNQSGGPKFTASAQLNPAEIFQNSDCL